VDPVQQYYEGVLEGVMGELELAEANIGGCRPDGFTADRSAWLNVNKALRGMRALLEDA
jgi:hypothetical protein